MMGQEKPGSAEHHDNNPGRLGALALSLLEALLHRQTPPSPRSKNTVFPQWSKRARNSRVPGSNFRSMREERSRREVRSRREGNSTREGQASSTPNPSLRRSKSAKLLRSSWSSRRLHQSSVSSRSSSTKILASTNDKKEAPEVVTNYVYDMPDKKLKPKMPGADYDDHDELENDDFDPDLDDEEESEEEDELYFELRPFVSEDEDEIAYFAHRMGGSDFKMLRRRVLHPHGRIRSIWDTITLLLTTCRILLIPIVSVLVALTVLLL
ncbi:unnamed protein product [Phytophthora fragariaefolia]|uniref:Unnamed protein product n=1 Tax=Phytophthora fragariaefolia TaxID=1490495 RepID=A0A9W6TLB9_9STRA|nr:unnamed protein product [Phytophthora fragariaefolia]